MCRHKLCYLRALHESFICIQMITKQSLLHGRYWQERSPPIKEPRVCVPVPGPLYPLDKPGHWRKRSSPMSVSHYSSRFESFAELFGDIYFVILIRRLLMTQIPKTPLNQSGKLLKLIQQL